MLNMLELTPQNFKYKKKKEEEQVEKSTNHYSICWNDVSLNQLQHSVFIMDLWHYFFSNFSFFLFNFLFRQLLLPQNLLCVKEKYVTKTFINLILSFVTSTHIQDILHLLYRCEQMNTSVQNMFLFPNFFIFSSFIHSLEKFFLEVCSLCFQLNCSFRKAMCSLVSVTLFIEIFTRNGSKQQQQLEYHLVSTYLTLYYITFVENARY